MSITVRLWEKDELEKAKKDEWLATLLMNKSTYSQEELKAYHSIPFQEREFICFWEEDNGISTDPIKIQATSMETLRQFLSTEYRRWPDRIMEHIQQFKDIDLDKIGE